MTASLVYPSYLGKVNNVITKSRFPLDFLKNVCKASKNVILISNNIAHYSYRLKFFFYGSLFVKNNFDIPNITIEEPWYDQSPWRFSVKDIVNLCSNGGLRVAKGFYFDSSEDKILNIYDMRNYPNLYAKKVFYLITNESFETTIPFSLSLKGI